MSETIWMSNSIRRISMTPIWCQRDQKQSGGRYVIMPSATFLVVDLSFWGRFSHLVSNEVIPHVYMHRCIVMNWISEQGDDALTIAIENWSRVGVGLLKRACQPSKPQSFLCHIRGGYVFNFNGWGHCALLEFWLPRYCSIAELKVVSGCRLSVVHTISKVWISIADYA